VYRSLFRQVTISSARPGSGPVRQLAQVIFGLQRQIFVESRSADTFCTRSSRLVRSPVSPDCHFELRNGQMTKALLLLLLISGSQPATVTDRNAVTDSEPSGMAKLTDSQTPVGNLNSVRHSSVKIPQAVAFLRPTATLTDPDRSIPTLTPRARVLRRRQVLRGGASQTMDGLISLIQSNVAPDCWDFSGTGFSGGSGASSGNGGETGRQNAENLAELIQQTIQPTTWQVNGGNGSISLFP